MIKTDFTPQKHGFQFGNHFVDTILKTPFGNIQTRGRCGGMAFASLDFYYSGIPVPSQGIALGDYIYRRSVDSIFSLSAFKFLSWKRTEFSKLKRAIDKGNPVVLGLISGSKGAGVTKHHQVVAYGYDEPTKDKIVIFIYDSNSPNQEVVLESVKAPSYFKASNGSEWRGFFVQNYKYKRPVVSI
jgi:hypothetical protein